MKKSIKKMKKNIKKKWLAALRSGSYRQCKGTLSEKLSGMRRTYCCLGVLCRMMDTHIPDGANFPSMKNLQEAGLSTTMAMHLARMNDDHNKTFKEIADYIEREL